VSEDAKGTRETVAEAAEELLRHLVWLEAAGVSEVPPGEPRCPPAQLAACAARAQEAAGGAVVAPPPGPSIARAERQPSGPVSAPAAARVAAAPLPAGGATPAPAARPSAAKGCGSEALLAVRHEIGECARCKLGRGRTNLVFGVGNPRAELVFVGEGPGEDEDLSGEPFVGRAGQLLTKMIEAMGYRREEVYIANVVKCRPPGNRNPEPDEIAACEPFLRAQLAAIGPKVIVALGKFAAHTLLRETTPISKLRGRWHEYAGVKLMPTFHPAYLLRSPEEKRKAWEDLQAAMRELGRPVPGR
jgi:uracil-DNA glycosylase